MGELSYEGKNFSKIRAVFFDLDETLIYLKPNRFNAFCRICAKIGLKFDDSHFFDGLRAQHKFFLIPEIQKELSFLPKFGFRLHLNRYLLQSMNVENNDLEYYAKEVTSYLSDIKWGYECPPVSYQVLDYLCRHGYKLGLLTNRRDAKPFNDAMSKFDLWKYFKEDWVILAGAMGIPKPNRAIFKKTVSLTGLLPSQIAYVGDNYWADVVGAQEVGIVPVLLDPRGLYPEASCITLNQLEGITDIF